MQLKKIGTNEHFKIFLTRNFTQQMKFDIFTS